MRPALVHARSLCSSTAFRRSQLHSTVVQTQRRATCGLVSVEFGSVPSEKRFLIRSSTQQTRGMKIYTKTGDAGTSGLFNGERRQKDDDVFEALGTCDELNAAVGMSMEYCEQAGLKDLCPILEEVCSRLFDVGAAIATPLTTTTSQSKINRTQFGEENVAWLEKQIDQMDLELEPLKNFILPSGGLAASSLHFARTLARRAERRAWPLIRTGQVDPIVGKYLNRLSDFLFTIARVAAKRVGAQEKIYKKARAPATGAEGEA